MAKLLFVQANYNINSPTKSAWVPVALVGLATILREKGNEVKIFDRNLYPDDRLFLKTLKRFNPDIVGLTCYTSKMISDVKRVSMLVKKSSQAIVIIGGVHATLEPKSLLDFPYIDYVVRGEGELALVDICNLINKKKATHKNISKIANVNFNKMRAFINLNDFPLPDYDLVDIKKYPIITFETSRGCPGRCKFCYNQGRMVRMYNTENTIRLLTRVLDNYNIKEFTIADDNFANLSKRTENVCKALSKYNAIFHCFLRVDNVQDKVMENLKKAGCWSIQFGFESGSQRILDFIQKDTTIEQNIKAIQQCKKYRIYADGSFMIGLPTETPSDLKKTKMFIKRYKPDAVDIKVYKPYPSTELYEYSIKHRLMERPKTLDDWERFCLLKEGEPNLSKISTKILLNTIDELSKTPCSVYIRKGIRLLISGHRDYLLFKIRRIASEKLGLIEDYQKA